MRLYPPYKKWKVEILNPESFHQFLLENIEYNNTNHLASLRGKLSENKFIVERKLVHNNASRPQIKGVIETSQNGKQRLTLSIESRKTFLYITILLAIIFSITAISRSNALVLIAIPITATWLYIVGLILHKIELKKTKVELNNLIEKASIN